MLRRPSHVMAVVPDESSQLPWRLEALGYEVEVVPLDWWLEPTPLEETDAVVLDVVGSPSPSLIAGLLKRGAQRGAPAVWVTEDAPASDKYWMDTEVVIPVTVPASASDASLEAAILMSARIHFEVAARRAAEAQARRFQDLASRLSIGLFRYYAAEVGSLRVEYFSHRAHQLLDLTAEQLDRDPQVFFERMLPEDRDAYRKFVVDHRTHRRPGEIRIRMYVQGRIRTLLLRFDEPQIVEQGVSVQGIIEDVTEETLKAGYGDRALTLLRGLRDNLQFLDLVEPAPPPPGGVFSKREREVFQLLRAGLSNAQIGLRLQCSESTIKKHVSAIYEKAGVHTRAQLLTVDWNVE